MAYLIYREHTSFLRLLKMKLPNNGFRSFSISWMKENGRRDVNFLTNSQALCLDFRERQKTLDLSGQKTGSIVKSWG
jgi:hypothetical protein